jgi:N-acetylmuramoyl-L-alanine amidase
MRGSIFILITCVLTGAHAAEVQNLRMWSAPERTRVVFELSESPEVRFFTMRDPERLVIDFTGTYTRKPLTLPSRDQRRVAVLRYARRGEHDLRVVLDLNKTVEVRKMLLQPNRQYAHRLVFDLIDPESAQPPAEAAADTDTREARGFVVAVDAGHGGEDVGAIGPSGVYEKDIALAVARELATLINQQEGMRAVLIRDGDYYVGLRQRMEKAREHKADLFVSVHADAFRDARVRGATVYVLSQRGASSEAARWVAESENASDLVGGVTLEDKDDVLRSVLIDLSQTASLEASIDAATDILSALERLGKVHKKKVQHAGFVVLKSPDIPSLLVETAYISNPADEKRLRSKRYRRELAGALFTGISEYFEISASSDTRLAGRREHKVTRGDTLSAIAEQYDVSLESIKLANNMNGDLVKTGAVLRIP